VDYYQSHYSSSNVIVCVAGAVNQKDIEEKIKSYFSRQERDPAVAGKNIKVAVKEVQKSPAVLLHYKKTDQTHFCLGVRAYDLLIKENML